MARLRDIDKGSLFGGQKKSSEQELEEARGADKKLLDEIEQVEKDINELRSTYELYFMGIEKLEPTNQRDLLKAEIRRWQNHHTRNTAIKFKMQQIKARFISLETYWQRTTMKREAGTYHRDKAKVARREAELKAQEARAKQLREAERGRPNEPNAAPTEAGRMVPEGQPITGAALREGRSAAETAGRRPAGGPVSDSIARPSASSAADLTEPKLRKLYQTYTSARRRCGENADLRYEDMAAALRKQVPKLMTETGAKAVEFKVVIRGGRAVLKAVPKH